MGSDFRMTLQTQMVLRVLLSDFQRELYGLEIAKAAGLPSGSIYPILARLETTGWITSDWENINEAAEGRRRRRYYKLTLEGRQKALEALESTKRRMFPELSGVPV
jgi:PadR family transcriptional regulator, regulatory protein PadR